MQPSSDGHRSLACAARASEAPDLSGLNPKASDQDRFEKPLREWKISDLSNLSDLYWLGLPMGLMGRAAEGRDWAGPRCQRLCKSDLEVG
jgi:hypothetical protein